MSYYNIANNFWLQVTEGSSSSTSYSKAKCFLPLMMQKAVYLQLHFLLDVLEELKVMSMGFQATDAGAVVIHRSLRRTLAVLKKYQTWQVFNISFQT